VQALTPQLNLALLVPVQLVVFIEKEAGECMAPSPSDERIWSWKRPVPCCVCTCGARSKHFIDEMMNLAVLLS